MVLRVIGGGGLTYVGLGGYTIFKWEQVLEEETHYHWDGLFSPSPPPPRPFPSDYFKVSSKVNYYSANNGLVYNGLVAQNALRHKGEWQQ
jgi:hypothetical protein